MAKPGQAAFYPGRAPVDAYGNFGFRFAGMSHQGSVLMLPGGIHGWDVAGMDEVSPSSFDKVFVEADAIDLVLLGTGDEQRWPSRAVEDRFSAAGIGLECMATGAAVRTYNVLLGEGRAVAAALIAVDVPPSSRR